MTVPLLARFPKLRTPAASRPVVPVDKRAGYPAFAADFEVLDQVVAPAFERFDVQALCDQNRYRRQQVFVLLGSAILTGLGGLQAVVPGQRWPGLLLAALGVLLATSSRWAGERSSLSTYLDARVKAERLRAVHFEFLSRTGRYAGDSRVPALRRAVIAVEAGKEPE